MRYFTWKKLVIIALFLGMSVLFFSSQTPAADKTIQMLLCYRTGPYAPGGSGQCGGLEDYLDLVNIKGGIDGNKIEWEECETAYDTARGIECYERLKSKSYVVYPYSTGILYGLTDRSLRDKIPIVGLAFGRSDAADGTVFPYQFPLIANWWSQASVKVRFMAQKEGGEDKLKGKKIALLHLDVPYGRETIPIMERLAKEKGFEFKTFPVPPPGLEQGAQWLDIARRYRADWTIVRNWGVSCTVALKEAAKVGFARNKIIGNIACNSEEDVIPAAEAAKDYITTSFNGVGKDFPVLQEILTKVYGAGKGNLEKERVGSVYYNRGVIQGIIAAEAVRASLKKYGPPVIGEQMKWALEHLDISEDKLKEIGASGFMPPVKTTPEDHEGGGWVKMQQWDGTKWVSITSWLPPYKEMVWDEVKKSAAKYREEKEKK